MYALQVLTKIKVKTLLLEVQLNKHLNMTDSLLMYNLSFVNQCTRVYKILKFLLYKFVLYRLECSGMIYGAAFKSLTN